MMKMSKLSGAQGRKQKKEEDEKQNRGMYNDTIVIILVPECIDELMYSQTKLLQGLHRWMEQDEMRSLKLCCSLVCC